MSVSARLCELFDTELCLYSLSEHRQVFVAIDPLQARLDVQQRNRSGSVSPATSSPACTMTLPDIHPLSLVVTRLSSADGVLASAVDRGLRPRHIMPGTCPHTQARPYGRHEPEKHPLYQVLAQHLETFLQRTRTADHQLPDHVEQELRAYLRCGILYVLLDIYVRSGGKVRVGSRRHPLQVAQSTQSAYILHLEQFKRFIQRHPLPQVRVCHPLF